MLATWNMSLATKTVAEMTSYLRKEKKTGICPKKNPPKTLESRKSKFERTKNKYQKCGKNTVTTERPLANVEKIVHWLLNSGFRNATTVLTRPALLHYS